MNIRLVSRTLALVAIATVGTASLQSVASPSVNGPTTYRPMDVTATASSGMPQTAQTLWAVVDPTGVNIRSLPKSTTKSTHLATGQYEVDFYENVSNCAYVATVGPAGEGAASGYATVAARSGNVKGVFVETFNTSGVVTDLPFHLAVHC